MRCCALPYVTAEGGSRLLARNYLLQRKHHTSPNFISFNGEVLNSYAIYSPTHAVGSAQRR